MTIAKNFVTSGHWAANKMDFSSAASSPLWSLAISGVYLIFGINVYTPFILNLLFGFLAICAAYYILYKSGIKKYSFAVLLIFLFTSPLTALLFTGMEHSAQIAFTLLFVYMGAKLIVSGEKSPGGVLWLILIAALLTGLRYEDVFLVLAVSVFLAVKKKYLPALLILLAGALPIIIYGIISSSHGWYFLPNPVLVKSKILDLSTVEILKIIPRAIKRTLEPDIIFLLPAMIFSAVTIFKNRKEPLTQKTVMLIIFISVYAVHMTFAQTGWFFRYEAYLVAMGVIVLYVYIYEHILCIKGEDKNMAPIYYKLKPVIYVIMILSMAGRASSSFLVPQASNNIYEQQYQMAAFVDKYANGLNIAANDIGMLGYYTDNRIVDLWGLADIDVAGYKLKKTYNTDKIEEITQKNDVKFVIVYEHWFDQYGGLPADWVKIGEWKMNKLNIVCGAETAAFYSLDRSGTEMLRQKLAEFSKNIPPSVTFIPY